MFVDFVIILGERGAPPPPSRLIGFRATTAKGYRLSAPLTTIVLTNDDGIGAPGLVALEQAVSRLGIGPYRVVAPAGPCSGCGHQVTTHQPIEIIEIDEEHVSVSGTPADCVRLALFTLAPAARLIISGINPGGNLGADVFHSGTVAAVREGGLFGVPGIALSHYIARGRSIDWGWAADQAVRAIRELIYRPWPSGTFWNVNFPHLDPSHDPPVIVTCPVDPSPLPLNYRLEAGEAYYSGDYQSRARVDQSDVSVCFGGSIAASLIRVVDPGAAAEPIETHRGRTDVFRTNE